MSDVWSFDVNAVSGFNLYLSLWNPYFWHSYGRCLVDILWLHMQQVGASAFFKRYSRVIFVCSILSLAMIFLFCLS